MGNNTQQQGQEGRRKMRRAELQYGIVLAFHVSAPGGPAFRIRALRPSSHPVLADAVEAQHREALRRHGGVGMVSMTSPLRAMSTGMVSGRSATP